MSTGSAGSVVIIGGGVIGMAAALELTRRDAAVTIVDPTPGRGASWAAAGMLSPDAEIAPGEESLVADLRRAAVMWPAFADRVTACGGLAVDFEPSASVVLGSTASDARDAARSAALMQRAGAEVAQLEGEQLSVLEPSLAASIHAGWVLPADSRVDNRRLVLGLLEAVKAQGVHVVEDACVRIDRDTRAVRVHLEHHGALEGDHVVLATGAARPLPGTQDLGLPSVRPVRGVTLRLSATDHVDVPSRTIRGFVDGMQCYLVPRADGSLVVGATSEEQGYVEVARTGGIFKLLEAARTLVPGVDELTFEEAAVGLRPATVDHLPFVGALADARIVAALGHYRNGILLAPLAGLQVADLVTAS